jgi:hypothetical protein
MYVSRTLLASILLAAGAIAAACGGKFPKASTANCGDQCVTMTCPPGSNCTLTANCTPRCDPQPLPVR